MKVLIAIFVLLLMGSGCCNQRPITQQHTVSDSTYVERTITVRDTVLIAPAASASLSIDCDSLRMAFERGSKPVQISEKQLNLRISDAGNGRIAINCECDTLAIEAKLRDTMVTQYRERTETTVSKIPVKVIPVYVKAFALFGAACGLFLFGLIIITVKKAIT